MTTRYELLKEVETVAQENGIRLKGLNFKNDNKKVLESILTCFKLSKKEMTKYFEIFKSLYPASAKQLENCFMYYGWGRYHIYCSVKRGY